MQLSFSVYFCDEQKKKKYILVYKDAALRYGSFSILEERRIRTCDDWLPVNDVVK